MRLQITVLYIRCEMTPTYAGGEQQECRGHSGIRFIDSEHQKLKKDRGNIEII